MTSVVLFAPHVKMQILRQIIWVASSVFPQDIIDLTRSPSFPEYCGTRWVRHGADVSV